MRQRAGRTRPLQAPQRPAQANRSTRPVGRAGLLASVAPAIGNARARELVPRLRASAPLLLRQLTVTPQSWFLTPERWGREKEKKDLDDYLALTQNDRGQTFEDVLEEVRRLAPAEHWASVAENWNEYRDRYRTTRYEEASDMLFTIYHQIEALYATHKIRVPKDEPEPDEAEPDEPGDPEELATSTSPEAASSSSSSAAKPAKKGPKKEKIEKPWAKAKKSAATSSSSGKPRIFTKLDDELKAQIAALQKTYGKHLEQHIFEGEMSGSDPTGYHSENEASGKVKGYGKMTPIPNCPGCYYRSVYAPSTMKVKSQQSSFFPAGASRKAVMDAIFAVYYLGRETVPEWWPDPLLAGLPIWFVGKTNPSRMTCFPGTGDVTVRPEQLEEKSAEATGKGKAQGKGKGK